ncbi:MAG TPA: hypothetical protein VIX90_00110 [Edaphobacter sp.]
MKSLRISSIFGSSLLASALAIGMVASTPSAVAQTGDTVVKANIPFDFQAGQLVMPAGEYQISKSSEHMLLLRATDQKATEFLIVHEAYASTPPTGSSLVFDRYGNKYFLRQIWTAGNHDGLECTKGRIEKRVEAENKQDASPVIVALNTYR